MKKVLLIVFILTVNLTGLPLSAHAQDEGSELLKLYVGEIKILPANNPSRIVIGNPGVADVTEVSKTEIAISPKKAGTTTLVFWDNFGEQSYKLRVVQANLDDTKRRIDYLLTKLNLPQVNTQIAEDEGKILLLGRVKNAQDREKISTALGPLKDQTTDLIEIKEEESVVEIDVQVIELDKDATKTLGFSWPGSTNIIETTASPAYLGTTWGKLFKVTNVAREASFNLQIDALIQEGKARILSRPRLACQSGKEAELLVGGEKPILTTGAVFGAGTTTQVEYKEFGIKLKIKPTVTEEKRVKLSLNVEVSEVGTAEILGPTANPIARAYPLSKRNASTELYLDNGQTLAIGGLMKQKHEEDVTRTPFLSDIPFIGALFRKKVTLEGSGSGQRGDVELFITLTPTIVSEGKNALEPQKESQPIMAPAVSGAETIPGPLAVYARIIQRRIVDNLTYPTQAKDAGFQGTVKLSLHLSYKGELLEAILKGSSGYKILDDQAISVARGIGSYPPFPAAIEQKELWLDVPIAYQLN